MNGPSDDAEFARLRELARERMRLIHDEQERVHREVADTARRPIAIDVSKSEQTKP